MQWSEAKSGNANKATGLIDSLNSVERVSEINGATVQRSNRTERSASSRCHRRRRGAGSEETGRVIENCYFSLSWAPHSTTQHPMTSGSDFESWMLAQGRAERTAKSYAGAVTNKLSVLALENHIINTPLLEYAGAKPIERIVHEVRELEDFKLSDSRGNGMYSAALRQLVRYRAEHEDQSISKDLEILRKDPNIEETDRESLVNARVGQGRFRDDLIKLRGRCVATRYDYAPILTASHIKPWKASSNQERLNPFNGFLLIPTLDKVFDRGLITFTDEGRVKISDELPAPVDLGIDPTLRAEVLPENREFLAYHREVCFRS